MPITNGSTWLKIDCASWIKPVWRLFRPWGISHNQPCRGSLKENTCISQNQDGAAGTEVRRVLQQARTTKCRQPVPVDPRCPLGHFERELANFTRIFLAESNNKHHRCHKTEGQGGISCERRVTAQVKARSQNPCGQMHVFNKPVGKTRLYSSCWKYNRRPRRAKKGRCQPVTRIDSKSGVAQLLMMDRGWF